MNEPGSRAYSVTIEIEFAWQRAYDYLAEPMNLGRWALGCWNTRATDEPGLYMGTSLFDQSDNYFRVETNRKQGIIDFWIGERAHMQPRISLRVIPGEVYGRDDMFCLVTMDAWRDVRMSDERWRRLCISHETEILLIKTLLLRDESPPL